MINGEYGATVVEMKETSS